MNNLDDVLDEDSQQYTEELSDELMVQLPSHAFWVQAYAILYLFFNLFFAIAAIILMAFMPTIINFWVVAVTFLFIGVSFWANITLFAYNNQLRLFIKDQDMRNFIKAMEKRKIFWRTSVWGIISTIALIFIFIFFVASFINDINFW